ncbi:hypothetical protein K6U06_06660 [Acidiferrimicrobium sp. IK]|uniref:hypothetical protein n=1 Tax=Acidiferrimicrobium sp. IK TaxID=2871700 RepID=UPI0021CB9832|nr:hypothetical protein [Acidiferrimicrobium sp. IK]MCU4184035.1 hypothetical protein [Acidiferrimicrobium sp. IK]
MSYDHIIGILAATLSVVLAVGVISRWAWKRTKATAAVAAVNARRFVEDIATERIGAPLAMEMSRLSRAIEAQNDECRTDRAFLHVRMQGLDREVGYLRGMANASEHQEGSP